MADAVINLSVKDVNYTDAISRAQHTLDELNRSNGVAAAKFSTVGREIRKSQRDIQALNEVYRRLSSDMKNSDLGQELQRQIRGLEEESIKMQKAANGVKKSMEIMSSPTFNFDTASSSISYLTSVLSTLSSTYGAVTNDESTMIRMMNLANAATNVNTTITAAAALVQKTYAIRRVASTAATKLATVATNGSTVATKAATIAQAAFNAVANANPYVLLAEALLAVGAALVTFIAMTNDGAEAEENMASKSKSAASSMQKDMNDVERATNQSISKQVTKINYLSNVIHNTNASYSDRKKAIEELQSIIPDYHAKLTKEGKLYNDNTSAIAKYVKNLKAAARAQAAFAKIVEIQEEALDLQLQKSQWQAGANGALAQRDLKVDVIKKGNSEYYVWKGTNDYSSKNEFGQTPYEYHQSQTQHANTAKENIKKIDAKLSQNKKESKYWEQFLDIDTIKDDGKSSGGGTYHKGGGSSSNEEEFKPGSIGYAEQELKKAQEKEKKATSPEARKTAHALVEHWEAEIYAIQHEAENQLMIQNQKKFGYKQTVHNPSSANVDASMVETMNQFSDVSLDIPTEPLEEVNDNLENTIDNFQLAAEASQNLSQALTALGASGGAAKAGAIMAALGSIALGFAQAAKAQDTVASGWGWLVWVSAGLAALTTMASTIKGLANGGVVGGGSNHGDMNLIRANAGEMILNGTQQARLFDIIDGTRGFEMNSSNVQFHLRGSDLYGCFKNYNNKMSKAR